MLLNWNFDNSYLKLPNIFYSLVNAEKFDNPELLLYNEILGKKLNLDVRNLSNDQLALILSGQKDSNNNFFSQAYAGHQFGNFTILGDGRALLLGEHINNENKRYDIQLKGSGRTPYSRNGDGKAALGPMLREYIISESMHYLNVPTTRSLSVVLTGEKIYRDKSLHGAILTRVAESHIRIGTFQFANLYEKTDYIKDLTEYTINRHFPEIKDKQDKVENFLIKVMDKQIELVIHWMRVGFIHGVLNTDNSSIVGETIDYGPCAFMDNYNPKTVFSSIDNNGRYSYENQPRILLWNIARLAETVLFLINKDQKLAIKKAENILAKFQIIYQKKWLKMMKSKIGLFDENTKDLDLIKELLNIMHVFKLDYTNTFLKFKYDTLNQHECLDNWIKKYKERKLLEKSSEEFLSDLINKNNPEIIPRNHIIEKLLNEAENKNFSNLNYFLEIIRKPYSKEIPEKFKKMPKTDEIVHETYCGT